jgi:hypothetical protein
MQVGAPLILQAFGVVLQFPNELRQLHREHHKNYTVIIRSRLRPQIGP